MSFIEKIYGFNNPVVFYCILFSCLFSSFSMTRLAGIVQAKNMQIKIAYWCIQDIIFDEHKMYAYKYANVCHPFIC